MPKVKPLTESERRDAALTEQLWGKMKNAKLSGEEVAKMLGIGKNTFYRRIKHPEDFTLGEIRTLQKIFPGIQIE